MAPLEKNARTVISIPEQHSKQQKLAWLKQSATQTAPEISQTAQSEQNICSIQFCKTLVLTMVEMDSPRAILDSNSVAPQVLSANQNNEVMKNTCNIAPPG